MNRSNGEGDRRYAHITVRPSLGALGAEISGPDLSESLPDAVFAEIYRAWLDHGVVFFRDQSLRPDHLTAFARGFGELDTYPFIDPLPDHPAVIPIVKEKDTRFNFGGGWHSDTPYQEKPPKATLLYAIDVPASGGDTMFADMVGAYEALSSGMKDLLDGLKAVFTASKVHGTTGYYSKADHPMAGSKDAVRVEERFEHPIVRTHPETGRKALFVSLAHIERFVDMRVTESEPLLQHLARGATQAERTTRFRWDKGSLAIWDNRCVQHYALNDYPGQRREMHRVTIRGDVPY